MITNFNDLFAELKAKGICKRMVAAWGVDSHTIEAASLASDKGFVKVTLVGDADMIAAVCNAAKINIDKFTIVDIKDELKAVAEAVRMVHDGEGDVLMKGLCSTDKFLRAILNKECGLLPAKGLLSHVGVIENPNYHKLIFITDMAVIPAPDFRQKVKMAGFRYRRRPQLRHRSAQDCLHRRFRANAGQHARLHRGCHARQNVRPRPNQGHR